MGDPSIVGHVGPLVVATRGSDGPGEVELKVRGGIEVFLAWSDEPLPRGATVLVIGAGPHRSVDVVSWTDPVVTTDDLR